MVLYLLAEDVGFFIVYVPSKPASDCGCVGAFFNIIVTEIAASSRSYKPKPKCLSILVQPFLVITLYHNKYTFGLSLITTIVAIERRGYIDQARFFHIHLILPLDGFVLSLLSHLFPTPFISIHRAEKA